MIFGLIVSRQNLYCVKTHPTRLHTYLILNSIHLSDMDHAHDVVRYSIPYVI